MATENVVPDLRNPSVKGDLTSGIRITANPLCRDRRKRYFPNAQTPLRSTMNANVQKKLMTAENIVPDLRNPSVKGDLTSGIRMTANPLCRDHGKRYFPVAQAPLRSTMNANVQKTLMTAESMMPDLRNPSVKDGLTSGTRMTANPLCRDRRKRYFPVAQTPLRSTMNANVQKTLMAAESMMPDLRNPLGTGWPDFRNTHDRKPIMP